MCGNPAVPNIKARPSDIDDSGFDIRLPGAMMASFFGCSWTALANIASGLKPNSYKTAPAMNVAPNSSRMALMICTQVVAFMPPNVT